MALTKNYIRKLLRAMDFSVSNGIREIWEKKYPQHNDYFIQVNFDDEEIIYLTGKPEECIVISNKTTSNFSKDENFVVLECVNKLLDKGYKPNSIELEHYWPSGHGTSGRLDIWVKKDNVSYLMIECKTYGKEFIKEKNNMLRSNKNGESKGQLLAYFWEENKTTEYLCLYASVFEHGDIKVENAIIPVEKNWSSLSNKKELFDYWNKSFKKNGIFEPYIKPYNIECKALLRRDLDKLTGDDSSRIFYQFLEILRHNAVSDKPNAFNKILNLFICKIIDEDRNNNEELQFQWKDDTTYVSMQSSLEELYKQGMERFLDIEVTDYSECEVEKNLLSMDSKSKSIIKKMFQELRLQKNPEFAFKEVYNHESFEENAKVLKEVVKLLEPYQFRYGHKQQFLGNFFEQLLNTSIKQESGQFFTPVPIARFMISSLPIKEKIDKNIQENKKDILPSVVDYACGSGHFLTEYMDIMQAVINEYDTTGIKKSVKNAIQKWKQTDNEDDLQGEFEWAKDSVYGIEKDYRLVKTAKISTFLNGDGEANIIHADGLDKFSSEKYKGLLKAEGKENDNFDFLIANPPYSVAAFKQTLPSNQDDFETYSFLTESSSEIECLFVERTEQLLKENGCAAVILPSSILTNNGLIYEKTREILLKNFYFKAIAKMGSNTFMATGVNTVILFLQKRSEVDFNIIQKLIEDFFNSYIDFTYNGTLNVINKLITECFEDINFVDYTSLIRHCPNDAIKQTEFYKELENVFISSKEYNDLNRKKAFKKLSAAEKEKELNKIFAELIDKNEKKRILYYLITLSNKTIIIDTGEKQQEKSFLGYEFSSRRGNEGIHLYIDEETGYIKSSLYDELEVNKNKGKVNYYINSAFNNIYPDIADELLENIRYTQTSDLLKFDDAVFENIIILSKKPKVKYNCESMPLNQCVNIKIGGTPSRKNHDYFTGSNLWVSIAEMNGQIINDTKEKITDEGVKESNVKLIKKGTTLLSFKLSIGKTAIAGQDLYTNEAIAALEIKDEYKEKVLDEYLFYLFKSKIVDIYGDTKAFGISLNSTTLGDVIIPVPDSKEQETLIKKYKDLNNDINTRLTIINDNKEKISNIIKSINTNYKSLSSLGCILNPTKDEISKIDDATKVSFVEMANLHENGYISKMVDRPLEIVRKKGYTYFAENDIIIAKITPCMENGKCAIAKGLTNGIGFGSTEYHVIRTNNKIVLSEYAFVFINKEEVRQLAKTRMTGKSGHRRVPEDFYKSLQIPYVDLPEQQKFVNKIKSLKDEIEPLEKEVQEIQEMQKVLIQNYI